MRGNVESAVDHGNSRAEAVAIVHVLDRVRAGHGRGLSALAIADAQYRRGGDVRLLLSGVHNPEMLCGSPPYEPLLGDLAFDVYRRVDAIDSVASALARHTKSGDAVVCHGGIDLAAACRLHGRRVVGAVHSDARDCLAYLPERERALIARRTDHFVVWGHHVAASLTNVLQIEGERVTVSAQGIDPGEPGSRRMTGTPACLSVARVHPVKNHPLMLQALALLARSEATVHWHMVGSCDDEAYRRELECLARQLGVASHVTWHGYRDDVALIMRGCDVVVLASLSEGVPRAIQEAIVLGVPTVMPASLAGDLVCADLPIMYQGQEPDALAHAVQAARRVDARTRALAAAQVAQRWDWATVLEHWKTACAR